MLKEKTKPVQIREQVHKKVKEHCNKKFLKLGKFIEDLILKELEKEGK